MKFHSHELLPRYEFNNIKYDLRPVLDPQGQPTESLKSAWITLNNEKQLNSYTTDAVKEVILAFRRASEARDVTAVVFTGSGTRAFCTGGNTQEYAEYYAGRPEEYRRYMRLFNDMVTAILECEKPVICRVNGMRIAGGQEIGMACDFSIASDLAIFGQAGPKHGSAPDGGSTDFLPLFVGVEQAMRSCTLCEMWSAYEAKDLGLISEVVPVLKVNGATIRNPTVVTEQVVDAQGNKIYGQKKSGGELGRRQEALERGRDRSCPPRRRRGQHGYPLDGDHAGLSHPDFRVGATSQEGALGSKQGAESQLVRAQYDDRSQTWFQSL